MKVPPGPAVLAPLLAIGLLGGCSGNDSPLAAGASSLSESVDRPDDESASSSAAMRTDDPCGLLTDGEVQKVFSGAGSGRRNHGLDENGILTCVWETPTDRFVVQTFDAKSGSVEDELRSRMSGSVDPLMPGAGHQVRYETVPGVGDKAMSVLEKADPARGILADTAVLVTQRGGRQAVLFTGLSLASGDRPTGLQALETLGRSVAKRL